MRNATPRRPIGLFASRQTAPDFATRRLRTTGQENAPTNVLGTVVQRNSNGRIHAASALSCALLNVCIVVWILAAL
eukprot:10522471-Lingulodinium_polyedra.AAC.1